MAIFNSYFDITRGYHISPLDNLKQSPGALTWLHQDFMGTHPEGGYPGQGNGEGEKP